MTIDKSTVVVYKYTNTMKTKNGLIALTVRLAPETYRRLNEVVRRRPHLSLNVLINDILENEMATEMKGKK